MACHTIIRMEDEDKGQRLQQLTKISNNKIL
jgi:hypothetical protein